MFARVALDFYTEKEFDYRIPEALAGLIGLGTRVTVPFGNYRKEGTVVSLLASSPVGHHKIKDIAALAPGGTFLDQAMMELLAWVHRYYGGSMGKVIRCAVPAAVRLSRVKEANAEWVERAMDLVESLPARSPKDALVMNALTNKTGRVAVRELLAQSGASRQVLRRLAKKGWIRVVKEKVIRGMDNSAPIVFTAPRPVLSDEQRRVVDRLCQRLTQGFRCVLLYGVTGSGKTEVYLRLIEQVLQGGRNALILVPEIALTPQTIDRFRSRFHQPMAVLHSGLSQGERFDQWRLIQGGGARIVIGARSAVFAPLANIGAIIVDEEQDRSYKQQEAPHYHARDVAVMRAKLQSALIVLASATPSLESHHNAQQGKYELLELSARVDGRTMPRIEIVDMRCEPAKSHGVPTFSQRLAASIQARLDRKEQVMLFLNRRGYHRCLWCPTCAQALQCPHCSVTLTFHRVGSKLLCHLCGCAQETLSRCPQCAVELLIPQGYGTQKIEMILRKFFSKARIARMDADTTHGKNAHRDILSRFALGQFDILVGTQMIAKGHDFPNVTLVGILQADMGLNVPDFRAAEQAYQLLIQVSGRAGRGAVGGEVIVQTHMPGHFLMNAVKAGDFKKFYEREIALRTELQYPPKVHLMLLGVKHSVEAKAEAGARILHQACTTHLAKIAAVLAPCAAPIQKAKGIYRWQILLKTHAVARTQEKLQEVLAGMRLPAGVAVDVDVDPQVLA